MYTPKFDEIIDLPQAPRPDVGAPLPAILADEYTVSLVYIAYEPDPAWDGTYVQVRYPSSSGLPIALVRFMSSYAHSFGPPNDEAFEGHPLANRGLWPYSANEVRNSSWIRELERMNAVHPLHQPEDFEDYRHFIFAFHDSTFECVAKGIEVKVQRGSILSVLQACLDAMRRDAA